MIELIRKAQSGNKAAMNDLIGSCYQDLYYYAYKTVQNEDLAADITQESCLEIVTKLTSLREPGAFHVWARRIVYHQCTHHFRQVREVTVAEDEDGETILDRLPDESPNSLPEQVQEDKEFRQTLQAMLDSLPPEQRSAMVLYYYERLSVGQIAEIQGVSEGTIKSRLNYGRKAVKQKVEEYEKKTGLRLHGVAPLPLLLLLLLKSEKAKVLTSLPAKVAAIATKGAAAAVGISLGTKLAIGIGIALAAVGITIGALSGTESNQPTPTVPYETERSTLSTTIPSTEENIPPEETVLLGQWISLAGDGESILFNEDRTAIYKGKTYFWDYYQEYDEDKDRIYTEYILKEDPSKLEASFFYIKLSTYDDGRQLIIYSDFGDADYLSPAYNSTLGAYYNAEDYKNHEVIKITPDNIFDYLVFDSKLFRGAPGSLFYYDAVVLEYTIRFREDVSEASLCYGNLNVTNTKYYYHYNQNSGSITRSEPAPEYDGETNFDGTFFLFGYGEFRRDSWQLVNEEDSAGTYKYRLNELTINGANEVYGIALIPKN